jgi:hypothetical protein
MQQYGISESRIKRIIRFPTRTEEGIVPQTVAVMQPTNPVTINGKRTWKQEIWVMYKLAKPATHEKKQEDKSAEWKVYKPSTTKIRVITAWRYPGISSERDPVPEEIIREVQALL